MEPMSQTPPFKVGPEELQKQPGGHHPAEQRWNEVAAQGEPDLRKNSEDVKAEEKHADTQSKVWNTLKASVLLNMRGNFIFQILIGEVNVL